MSPRTWTVVLFRGYRRTRVNGDQFVKESRLTGGARIALSPAAAEVVRMFSASSLPARPSPKRPL